MSNSHFKDPIAGPDEPVKRRKRPADFRRYTQQIWLAGLGAFSRAEEEGGRLFENLVKVGEELESKSNETEPRPASVDQPDDEALQAFPAADVPDVKLPDLVPESRSEMRGRLERLIDERLGQTLAKIGINVKSQSVALDLAQTARHAKSIEPDSLHGHLQLISAQLNELQQDILTIRQLLQLEQAHQQPTEDAINTTNKPKIAKVIPKT